MRSEGKASLNLAALSKGEDVRDWEAEEDGVTGRGELVMLIPVMLLPCRGEAGRRRRGKVLL